MLSIFKRKPVHTVSEVFETSYIEYASLNPASIRRYRCEINRWARFTGDPPLSELTVDHFTKFRHAVLAAGLVAESAESTVKVVKSVVRYARDRGWLAALPFFGKSLRIEAPFPEPATLAEIDAFYRHCHVASTNGRGLMSPCDWWRSLTVLMFFTGLRRADLSCGLCWDHIQTDRIVYRASKTSHVHIFPLCEPVVRHLALLQPCVSARVFGRQWRRETQADFTRICDAAGIRRLTSRNFRQAAVTQWLKADDTAGKLVHGCGLPHVLQHYVGVLEVLTAALERFQWPPAMLEGGGR